MILRVILEGVVGATAIADIFLACPLSIVGIVLVFVNPRWGYYLVGLVSF